MQAPSTRHSLFVLSASILLVVSACSTGSSARKSDEAPNTQPPETEHAAHHPDEQGGEAPHAMDGEPEGMEAGMCPMQVEGTQMRVQKLDDAVAMDFTTTGDVAALRDRVRKMARMHDRHADRDEMKHGGGQGHKGEMDMEMMEMMATTTAATEEIEGGMRLRLVPDDPDQIVPLHEMMNQHAGMMSEGGRCPMMKMMGKEQGQQEE
ncbi:MAG: hypothetical protein ACQEXJ_24185 [Myxococcota bacterium]